MPLPGEPGSGELPEGVRTEGHVPPPALPRFLLIPAQGLESQAAARPTQEQPRRQGWGVRLLACTPGLRPPKAQDTHADTRWPPRPCPGPTGGPGRRAGSARSLGPWCCAGIGRPAGPPRWGHTRWRARCICTWEKNTGVGGVRKLGQVPAEKGLITR